MATVYPYDSNTNSNWLNKINDNVENVIDYFFTQRKITEYEEVIEEKTLERIKKKCNRTYNFLAINFPTIQFKNLQNLSIEVEIWGDEMYNFKGVINKNEGEIPHLMIKLKEDKMIFVKLVFKNDDKICKTFINFIPVIKRYQMVPDTISDINMQDVSIHL